MTNQQSYAKKKAAQIPGGEVLDQGRYVLVAAEAACFRHHSEVRVLQPGPERNKDGPN